MSNNYVLSDNIIISLIPLQCRYKENIVERPGSPIEGPDHLTGPWSRRAVLCPTIDDDTTSTCLLEPHEFFVDRSQYATQNILRGRTELEVKVVRHVRVGTSIGSQISCTK